MTPDEREDYEERAAIVEFCANLPRDDAEREAAAMIARQREFSHCFGEVYEVLWTTPKR